MAQVIKNGTLINEGESFAADLKIEDGRISHISRSGISPGSNDTVIDASGKWVIPGVIDDQVHFREPGLTHKADIASESLAALAGGVTSFMEMPNVIPQTTTIELLEEKFALGAAKSHVNYSFYLGATNHNIEELLKVNSQNTCGIKIFMGSSTGDMLVDSEKALNRIFSETDILLVTHCESEKRIRRRLSEVKFWFGSDIPPSMHPRIRDEESCYLSSSHAVELAKKYNTRLHVYHISTGIETDLFRNDIPLSEKRITAEVCVHHLHFTSDDYDTLGNKIKCNPAIKAPFNRDALWEALLDDRLDVIATDHAPHTAEEKAKDYMHSPAGLPLVQHALQLMLQYAAQGKISRERVIEKMCHAPAICYRLKERGFLREGYFADIVIVDPDKPYTVTRDNILYKCGWSPMENMKFQHSIEKVFVNGTLSWDKGFTGKVNTARLMFDR